MATGGIFTIITNDGKQDRMLMATALLHDRLDRIWRTKKAQNPGVSDDDVAVLPSLLDIERTHLLFTNAHFKPFAAIGFEYNKVRPNSGSVALGSTVQFSIPQFGDFFHDIAFHCKLWQPTITNTATDQADQPAMRWAPYVGERLLKTVTQNVNGNPLDSYTNHATAAFREYRIAPNKLTAWKRCVGQEEAEVGSVRQRDWAYSGAAPDDFRVSTSVLTGNQTATSQKDVTAAGCIELFVPLLFWYNKDVRLAVPSVAIPYGQRFIEISLAPASELVGLVPRGASSWESLGGSFAADPAITDVELYINNIFVNPEVHKIYIKRVGFSLIRVHLQQTYNMNGLKSEDNVHLQQLKWPIEFLFVGAKVKDYYSPSSTNTMAQNLHLWDKYSVATQKTYKTSGQTMLRESALVTDASISGGLTLGFDTNGTLTGTAVLKQALAVGDQVLLAGSLYPIITPGLAGVVASASTAAVGVPGSFPGLTASDVIAAGSRKISYQGLEIVTNSFAPTLDTVQIQAHGIDIYKEFPAAFFNAYTTYTYGGPNINAPSDVGAVFVPFCLYPGTYQPSGHINVSRAREIYLQYTSNYFGDNNVSGLLVVIASAINFLLISDGSAVLRYST